MTEHAEIVVAGGGAVGLGVAWSLADAGRRDVLVVEREAALGRVTTSQGAGLCGQLRSDVDRTRLAMRSLEVLARLDCGLRRVGSLRLARGPERAVELEVLEKIADDAGLEIEIVEADEVGRRWPGLRTGDVECAIWCPSDAYLDPAVLTAAYERACRGMGVRFSTSTTVEDVLLEHGRVAGVRTDHGIVRCEKLVVAAGAHTARIAMLAGLPLPIVPVRHQYLVTASVPGLRGDLPCLRVPDASLYARADEDRLLVGGFEPAARSLDPRVLDPTAPPPPPDVDEGVLAHFAAAAAELVPAAADAEWTRVAKGWPTFTPDGRFVLGESSRVPGLVIAGGCTAHGISGSAGIGALVAEALSGEPPSPYLASTSPDRFSETRWDWEQVCAQARAIYQNYYGISC